MPTKTEGAASRELVPIPRGERALSAEVERLSQLDSGDLRRELADSLGRTARELLRLSLIVRVLDERGEDLSDLKLGLLTYLRRIAHGQILPEIVVRYGDYPALMRRVAALPLPDQARLADGSPVELVVRRDEGGFDRRMADPIRMTAAQVHQVFGAGKIRDEAEQILILEDRRETSRGTRSKPRFGRIVVERKKGGLKIGRNFVPAAEVVEALAALRGGEERETPSGEDVVTFPIKLSRDEHERLKHAAVGSATMQDLVRRALVAAGLI